jgi:prophage regulatory protein
MTTNQLPATGFVRLRQIIGDPRRGIPALIPVSSTTWWEGVKSGRYPKAHKIGKRAVAWRVEDIRRLIVEGIGVQPYAYLDGGSNA